MKINPKWITTKYEEKLNDKLNLIEAVWERKRWSLTGWIHDKKNLLIFPITNDIKE